MEAASLSLAHSHARNAVFETQKANPIAASEEHDLAAGEFANAAKDTADTEALRTLRLLEQHHLRLAEILKAKPEDTQSGHLLKSSQITSEAPLEPANQGSPTTVGDSTSQPTQHVVSPSSPHSRREASSSIASNLASARGIPPGRRRPGTQSLTQISPQTAEGRVVNPPRKSKLGEVESIAPDSDPAGAAGASKGTGGHALPPPIATANSDEPFSRFYSTFNNLITTLSAPLAFAGLPLNPAETAPTSGGGTTPSGPTLSRSPQHTRATPATAHATADPDLTRIFSRAALRAMREENGFSPVAESFYVVPTTGGTMSYAGMLSNARQASNLTEEDPDSEFVDARETPGHSPAQSRYTRHRRAGSAQDAAAAQRAPPGANKTWEELAVENETMKTVVVDLGDRLRAFELGAQKSSLALHASMRHFSSPTASSVVPGGKVPPMPGSAGGPLPQGAAAATKPLEDRIRELEDELKAVKKDNRRLGRENQKYLGVIEKYRERWEALKEGARERVKGGSSGGGSGGGSADRTGDGAARDDASKQGSEQ